MKNRLISLCIAIALILTMLPHISLTAYAASSSSCGDNLFWTFNYEGDFDGTLTISGTGEMDDYEYTGELPTYPGTPWTNNRGLITTGIIEHGVTSIGSCAFAETNITCITIPSSVVKIGAGAFQWCYDLDDVYFSGAEDQWETITIGEGNDCLLDAEIHYADNQSTDSDSGTSEFAQGYIAAVLKAIEDTQSYSWGDGYGALYDVDGNGIEELIMVYTVNMKTDDGYGFPAKACSVYTMLNGKAIQLIDKEILFAEAGGPSGHAAVLENNGSIYFAITSETGETGGGSGYSLNRYGSWKIYTIDGTSLELNTNVEYDYFYENHILYDKSTATINGQKCSYAEYEAWKNGLKEIFLIEPYGNEGAMTLEELLEYLKEHPVNTVHDAVELKAYTAFPESTIGTEQEVKIQFSLYVNGNLTPIKEYALGISNPSVIKSTETTDSNGSRIVTFKGLNPGSSDLTFAENSTGATITISVTVEDKCNYFRCSAFPIPYESSGSIYIADYSCTVDENGDHDITFNAYNTSYAYGVVEVYNENGLLIKIVPLDPRSDGSGMEKV